MWQVHEYFLTHPKSSAAEALDYFSVQVELDKQVHILKQEVSDMSAIRQQMKPLLERKADLDEQLRYIIIEIDTEVAVTYPPRQGSDKDRDLLRQKLKKEHAHYGTLDKEFKDVSLSLSDLQYRLDEIDRNAKNARRLTELFDSFARFLTEYCKTR